MAFTIGFESDRVPRMNESPRTEIRPGVKAGGRTCTLLSIVVPCFNEEEVLPEMHCRLVNVLESIPTLAFEIIYVDDGSRDATLDILRGFQQADSRVRVVVLSRNFGQQMALTAGLQSAAGEAVAVIDADLQDPPEVIIEMLDRWRQGVDVAYGTRTERKGDTAFKKGTAHVFYRLLNLLADIDIPLDAGEFRLMDRTVVDAVVAMPERDRLTRGIIAWTGFRQESVHFDRKPRAAGETKWSLRNMLIFAADGILSFSFAPLRLATWAGFGAAGLALVGIMYALALRVFTGAWITGWTALFIALLFLGGVQLVFLGILGEYVGRIYAEVKRRPLYLIKERLGFASFDEQTSATRVNKSESCTE